MEYPTLLSSTSVKPSDIASAASAFAVAPLSRGIEHCGADHNHVATDDRRRENGIQSPIHWAPQPFRQINAAVLSKSLYRMSSFGFERDEIPVAGAKEDASIGTFLPIRYTAMHESSVGGGAVLVRFRVMNPDCLSCDSLIAAT